MKRLRISPGNSYHFNYVSSFKIKKKKPHNLSPTSSLKQWTQLIACWDLLLSQVWGTCKGLIGFDFQEGPPQSSDVFSCIDACQRNSPNLSCGAGNYLSSDHVFSGPNCIHFSFLSIYIVKSLVPFVTEKKRNPWKFGRLLSFCISCFFPAGAALQQRERWKRVMLPWGKCKPVAEGQQICPCRCRGFFRSIGHRVGAVWGAAISKEQFSDPLWK